MPGRIVPAKPTHVVCLCRSSCADEGRHDVRESHCIADRYLVSSTRTRRHDTHYRLDWISTLHQGTSTYLCTYIRAAPQQAGIIGHAQADAPRLLVLRRRCAQQPPSDIASAQRVSPAVATCSVQPPGRRRPPGRPRARPATHDMAPARNPYSSTVTTIS
jgi:hypothetical protein